MTIAEQYTQYQLWVQANPKVFVVDNTNLVLLPEAVGAKVQEVTTAKNIYATSVAVKDNEETLQGFLAWSEQICGC